MPHSEQSVFLNTVNNKNMKTGKLLLIIVTLATVFSSCDRRKVTRLDTMTSGEAVVVADDCFSPIIDEEITVFQGINPEASITPVYTNEVEAIDMLMKDSARLIVVARNLNKQEIDHLKSKNLSYRWKRIALDGISLIVNNSNPDTIISVQNFTKILTGELSSWKQLNSSSKLDEIKVVFDNPNSSTVRYMKDSLIKDKDFSGDIRSMETNRAVLDFVSETPNAIGIIGVSWVSDPGDSTNLSFINKVRVMSVSAYDDARDDNSYKPFPAWIATYKYPLVREIFMIISDVRGGLPSGFLDYVAGPRGQRLIMKSGMVPATQPIRLVSVKTEF